MTEPATLFDPGPRGWPSSVRRGRLHPVSHLALDTDERRTCANCATRSMVWVGGDHHHAGRFEAVCAVVQPRCAFAASVVTGWEPGDHDGHICERECCEATCCEDQRREWERTGFVPLPAWPLASTVQDWMPACTRWRDLVAERVLHALGGPTTAAP